MPPTISAEQVRGFSLYMIKAVLSGRGDELIDLAKTNLFDRGRDDNAVQNGSAHAEG